ncbi:MAG: DUF3592 domain-containing protein [Candidatus Obscuribacterales bacterium]|nr:DUF3592 domain-containing protein [Candidatus Obscuribacterales bacterium]
MVALLVAVSAAIYLVVGAAGTSLDSEDVDAWINASAKWPSTTGKITNLSSYYSGQKILEFLHLGSWYPKVEYEYAVDGASFSSDVLGKPSIKFGSKSESETYLQSFKVGKNVKVFYDPKAHHHSALVAGVRLSIETKVEQLD